MTLFDPNRSEQRSPGRGSGIGGRIMVALFIALIGWLMYMNQVQENPVTGEKQHVAISPAQEIRLGLESAPEMAREMGGELSTSDPRAQEVKRMGQKIVQQTIAQKSPWEFDFHLLADPETVNAFALPGGQVFITLGLLNRLQTEAQLAGVLSHEVGHVIERHSAEQMAKSQFGQWLIMAVSSAAGGDQGGSRNAAVIASVVNQMMQLRYSRGDEIEADRWGLKLMEEMGYDPMAMVQVMEILKSASGGSSGQGEMFQTHPDPDHRIELIEAYLKEHPSQSAGHNGQPLRRGVRAE